MRFRTSVWVHAGDLKVLPVYTVEDACALLQRWPDRLQVGLFLEVRDVLEKAVLGSVQPDDARQLFVAFLDQANMLAECDPA
jgi:hypothetical protein